jgi:hypothetical protein
LAFSLVRNWRKRLGLRPAQRALEVVLAQADVFGDFFQFRLALEVGFDKVEGQLDALVIFTKLGKVNGRGLHV